MKKIFTLILLVVCGYSYSQTFILPSTGVQSTFSGGCPVGTCAGTLLDPGGAGNYSNNINSIYQTFCPTTPGTCLQVTFSAFNTENGFDYLTIGNGPAQNSAVFIGAPANASGQIMGTPAVPFSYTANNSSGCLTFRFRSDIITTRPGFTASLSCVPCGAALPAGNSDACASSFICSNLGFNDVSNGPGINPTEGCGGTNCVTGENYSNWYSFSAATSGSLTFTINPNTATNDFDYALFGPNVACGSLGTPLRCSYAANTGNTGLGNGAVDVSEDVAGDGWTSGINVTAGQTYMLMVNNWTAGGTGFNILFGGTATLGVLAPAVSSTSICLGQTAVLTATPATSGGTYTWTPGGANTQTISVSPGSTTSYSVVYAQGGCTSPASALATVTVNSVPTANAGSSTTLTCAAPNATLSGSGGGTYAWTGPSITSGSNTANPVVNAPGTYSLAVTSTAGCTSTLATVAISQNTTTPVTTATTTGSITCTTNTINLTSTLAGVNYTWTAPGGSSISSGVNSQNAVGQGSGTYSLLVVNPTNGCSVTATTAANVNNTAPVTTASSTGSITCTTNTINLTSTLAGVNYTWTAPAGSSILSGVNSQNAVGQGPGTYTITIQSTVNGCTNTAVTTANQNTSTPVTTASSTGSITCTTNTINLTSTLAGVNYTWTAPGGSSISSGVNSQNAVGQGSGTYTLLVINPVNGCSVTSTTAANINTVVPITTASSTGSITCITNTITLTSTLASANYTWSAPGGSSIVSGTNSQNAVGQGLGTYTLLVQSAVNGCTNTAVTSVNQNTVTPTVTMPSIQTITCLSPTVTLIGSAGPSSCTPVWTGGVCAGANTYSASACSPGSYTLTVTNPANGCVNSGTVDVVPSSGIPVVTASTNGSITCLTSGAEVSATTSMSDVTYSWSGPGAVSGASSSTGTVTVGGTYQCVVTNSLTGCASTITTVVNTNTTVPSSSITVGGVLTCSVTSVSLGCNLAGMNYTWAPVGTNTQSTSINVPGPCTLTVFDPSNGCTFSTTATVTQNTVTPTGLSAGTDQTLTCTSSSVTLNGSITTPTNASVVWTGAGVCGTTTSLFSAACAAGVYTLTATDLSNGCSSTSTVEVFANSGAPTATISSTALVLDCNNATKSVTVTSTPNIGVTYSWNTPPASVSANGDVATFNTPNTYICTVTNTLSNCSTPVQVAVTTDTTAPVVTISGTQTLTCANPTATISVTSTPSSGVTYLWSGTLVSGQGTNIVTVNQAGNYDVIVTNAANGCAATVSSQVIPDTNVPVASITASSSNSVITCQNTSVTLTTNVVPSGSYQYTWSSGAGSSSSASVTSASVYTVVVINSVSGCSTTAQYPVTGNTVPPTVTANNTVMPCGSPSVTLGATTTATNAGYNWSSFGSGSIISGANTSSPIAGGPGQYIVTVTDNDNGCSNTSTVTVTSIAITAAFTADPTSGTAPLLVNFTNQSSGSGNIYSWNFGDDNNNTSSSTNPAHTYNTTGTYVVTLVVTDPSGLCSSTSTVTIDVFENSSIIVPNVFTPNGDGKNDVFKITTTGIKDLNCDIFNRWGTKVANISGVNGTWDGSNVNDGTFFFILTATGFDGQEYKQQGYINLFR
ncbi:MAG TPA: gliding motility-associated C-terminal domain-containing protein [Bacteroidia bacterium]|nr:gliding motility-associated C-terminal domain-containing protein [Bacteroidia bacterium]